ncbi:hypothetical protein MHIP_59690 [Mycolicibacterium hippocampi]|uniref:Uncharacterized protein n=1 Tax=Mycolicibacterium hippocampi TaxID=659824 RepID=A0A7I9ZXP9_9MYCO|nr:hypothetical protein MHIP_59690 [Mycolicibacterium hippocampi]
MIFASATTAQPAITASELIGQTVVEVTDDGRPRGRTVALWEPALMDDLLGENGAPVRRSAGAEAARVMADLVAEGAHADVRALAGAELTALRPGAFRRDGDVADQVASYRAGYLAEDRRGLERALADGELRGVATTNALELGWTSRASMQWCSPVSRHCRVVLAAGR